MNSRLTIAILGSLAAGSACADGVIDRTPLTQAEWFGPTQPAAPPLSDNARWLKTGKQENCPGCTSNILSLIYDQPDSLEAFPWASYTQVTSRQRQGDAVGHFVRMFDYGSWAAAYHAETLSRTNKTSILYNGEMSPMAGYSGRTIGVNLQAKNGYGSSPGDRYSDQAINIQSDAGAGWKVGINFDSGVTTTTGIAMNNQQICFDPANELCLKYNPGTQRLELRRGSTLLQSW